MRKHSMWIFRVRPFIFSSYESTLKQQICCWLSRFVM